MASKETWTIRLDGRVKPVMGGVWDVLKSSGVRSLVASQANKAAARCNAMMDPQLKKAGGLYEASTKELAFVVAGKVSVAGAESGKFAVIDNRRNNTLKKGCGI